MKRTVLFLSVILLSTPFFLLPMNKRRPLHFDQLLADQIAYYIERGMNHADATSKATRDMEAAKSPFQHFHPENLKQMMITKKKQIHNQEPSSEKR